jgi:outer membrane protein W
MRRYTKVLFLLFLLVMVSAVGFVRQASAADATERLGSYVEVKGGIYSHSTNFDLRNIDVETTFKADTKTGVDGEIAFGHYFLPTLALELGLGYFRGTGSFQTTPSHKMHFNVIPVILSAKARIPVGQVDPYGELGIGAYFTSFKVSDNLNTFSGTTTFGLHAGAGVDVHITPRAFIGLEGRYVSANPSFGNERIKLNDTEYSLNGFKLNGFTMTLGLGYCF